MIAIKGIIKLEIDSTNPAIAIPLLPNLLLDIPIDEKTVPREAKGKIKNASISAKKAASV